MTTTPCVQRLTITVDRDEMATLLLALLDARSPYQTDLAAKVETLRTRIARFEGVELSGPVGQDRGL